MFKIEIYNNFNKILYLNGYKYCNEIHHKDEYWNEYDDNGNLIHFKNSNGFEYWK